MRQVNHRCSGMFHIFLTVIFAVFIINESAIPAERIVFTKEYYYDNPPVQLWCSDLLVMNTDGSGSQQLTNLGVPYTAEAPILSPDGQWIAFSSAYNSWRSAYYKDIFVISTNGTHLTRITGNENITPVDYGTLHGLIYDNTGTGIEKFQINITYQGSNEFYHPEKIEDNLFEYTIPNVPSGKIWVKCSVSQYKGSLIFPAINADQVNTVETMYLESGNYLAGSPDWAPDMSKIAGIYSYSCYDHTDSTNQCKGVDNISVWGIEGTQDSTRSTGYPFDCFPRYSPDGTKIAFSYGPAFQQSLVTVPSNNLNATPTVIVPGRIDYVYLVYYAAVYPAWSPDGSKIAFTCQALDANMNLYGGLYMVNSDGSDTTEIVPFTTNTFPLYPSFSLAGTKLIYTLMKSNGTYLNVITDLATHNYTTDIWKYDLAKKANTKLTTDGASNAGFWGNFNPPAVEEKSEFRIQNSELQVYPNPFTSKTVISYPESFRDYRLLITLSIYDISGKLIKSFNPEASIKHPVSSITWDAKDYPAGIYFLKFRTSGYERTEKLILIK